MSKELITIQYDYMTGQTPLCWFLIIDRKQFIPPKSLCFIDTEARTIDVPYWLVEKNGLEAYEVE